MKIKQKTNILSIIESISRQYFKLKAFNQGNQNFFSKRLKILKQTFRHNPALVKQLKLRQLLQTFSVKNKKDSVQIIESVIKVSKELDNSKIKKLLIKNFKVKDDYWIRPNKIQQCIGNLINNSKYYGMSYYQQQRFQVVQTLSDKLINQGINKKKINTKQQAENNLQQAINNFNSKYSGMPKQNKKLIKQFFCGSVIQQKKVMQQIVQLKEHVPQRVAKKIQFIVQNVSKLDKFDKVFLLTSILQDVKRGMNK